MSISKDLHVEIKSLSSKIESISREYPILAELWYEFFTTHYNRLSSHLKQGQQPAHDLNLIRDLGDAHKLVDYKPETIAKLVDDSNKTQSSDEFRNSIKEIIFGANWDSNDQRISAIKRLYSHGGIDQLSFLQGTFKLLQEILEKLEGDLKTAYLNGDRIYWGTRWVNVPSKTKPTPKPTQTQDNEDVLVGINGLV
ncbi:hypothetical protein G7B40_041160 [Aetokthonos hydrillicola Thurmond2011]|jgi:hypothetical protein|uniref:Uncharacterized protein n=1 Tax=Aetokthonos hydrillicola Thurmond2011 TaxID=2712845 RepID=A0AAP5IHP4_9CYAN|nr:hypothetical protein [Aetokthonos hydrillicola]MBW4591128.1 hypothetical protein [Aetokthonos hydrillicola CCALA 1050]MDR9900897.1 hypothetical protein [Aetokthonos hydrillicola Thurmond2011]